MNFDFQYQFMLDGYVLTAGLKTMYENDDFVERQYQKIREETKREVNKEWKQKLQLIYEGIDAELVAESSGGIRNKAFQDGTKDREIWLNDARKALLDLKKKFEELLKEFEAK